MNEEIMMKYAVIIGIISIFGSITNGICATYFWWKNKQKDKQP